MANVFRLFSLSLILLSRLVCSENSEDDRSSYARVATSGSNHGGGSLQLGDKPKIYKSLHSDLLPTFHETQTIRATLAIEDTEELEHESTGRAYMDAGSFPISSYGRFPKRPHYTNNRPSIVYPAYQPTYKRINQAMDRYTPGEAVASAYFKKNKPGYNYNPPKMKSPRPSSAGYIPPKDLYAFPPNLDSNYLPPTKPPVKIPNASINSYKPPPAGPADGFNSFVGPVNPEYLPPFLQNPKSKVMTSEPKPDPIKESTKNEMMSPSAIDFTPPPSDGPHFSHEDHFEPPDFSDSDTPGTDMDGPPMQSAAMDGPPMDNSAMDAPPMDNTSMQDNSPDSKPAEMDSPPADDDSMDGPGSNDHFPDHDHYSDHYPDHGHFSDHDHGHDHSFYGSHGVDAYPEIILDHDHFIHDHPPEVTTTTMAPEPPPEPRVKKYSYFYLGRKLWYIPLYFTVWFSFYIFWLIIKSIARHKVNLPNHYTGRMIKRSTLLTGDISHKDMVEEVDNLTATVMSYIDQFDEKYSNKEIS